MKYKLYSALVLLLAATTAFAQQCGLRYKDQVFSNVTVSTVTYSTPYSLAMDIYEPTGDTASQRPVIILAHGGAFYAGTKTQDGTVVQMCTNFAKRGYVTASIDYRLGNVVNMYLDSTYAITTVLKALSDGKAAIRYFRQDAATTNTYRINPNIIFAGGNSAGAVLYMHSIYVDSTGELPPHLQSIINANGGFEGNSGNPGYSSELQGLVNCAGALNIPEFIGPNSKPSANFQGDMDGTVPYMCDLPLGGNVKVHLCGLGAAEPLYNTYSVNHVSIVFPGDDHVPWDGDAAKFTRVDTTTTNFLYSVAGFTAQQMCDPGTGIANIDHSVDVSVFPNPAANTVNISFNAANSFKEVQLVDATGRLIDSKTIENNLVIFHRNQLASGLYFVRAITNTGSAVVRKVAFE